MDSMYIWLGIDIDDQLLEVKTKVSAIEKQLHFLHSNFTLPFHISLKISFPIDDSLYETVIQDLTNIYKNIHSFDVEVKGVEYHQTICWIKMKENKLLNEIHDILNHIFLEKYKVPLHEYDLDYQFHTTLFMDEDEKKVHQGYQFIRDISLPQILKVNKLIVGTSPNGKLGTYHVIKEYML